MRLWAEGERPGTVTIAAISTLAFVAVLWAIEIVDAATPADLDQYGIRPRSGEGLFGVVLAPLLHGGWQHLEANTVPTLVLLFLVLATVLVRGLEATAIIWVLGGIAVWLVAPGNGIHIGDSGLVFGWLTYVVARGFWTRNAGQVLIGVVIAFVYGGVLVGVLPGQPGISWQGHLFGALAGLVAAWLLGRGDRPRSAI